MPVASWNFWLSRLSLESMKNRYHPPLLLQHEVPKSSIRNIIHRIDLSVKSISGTPLEELHSSAWHSGYSGRFVGKEHGRLLSLRILYAILG